MKRNKTMPTSKQRLNLKELIRDAKKQGFNKKLIANYTKQLNTLLKEQKNDRGKGIKVKPVE